jgi:3-deoxy-D-manno-octulosonic-acid transferase
MLFLYNFFLSLYALAIRLYAPFNAKAKKWIDGRRGWEQTISGSLIPGERRIWIHTSSVGEFEQARPVIEALKKQYPAYKIVVTFFSPSGYEACKNNKLPDHVFYLPQDSKHNAATFIGLVQPVMAIFIKYEFWYHYLAELQKTGTTTALVSGAFRNGQVFFRWYGSLFRNMLQCFTFFFVQDEASRAALAAIGITDNVSVTGDTRYDRVAAISGGTIAIKEIEQFKGNDPILIAGSTWPSDEEVLKDCLPVLPEHWKVIIAPHEVDEPHIRKVQELFGADTVLYSEWNDQDRGKRILIINNIGLLSRLFAYGDIAYIGGGFQKGGIHNILEPAVFGLPVIFGPVYEKFVEAKTMAALKLVHPVSNTAEAKAELQRLVSDSSYRTETGLRLKDFMSKNIGATARFMDAVNRYKWLQ